MRGRLAAVEAARAPAEDASPALRGYLREVVEALESVADTTLVWPDGLNNPGGPHRRLSDMPSPISIGEDECLVFGKLVEALQPKHCFIVGNAFGLSSAYIARAMKEHGGETCVTLDSQTEGDGERCAAIARKLTSRLALDLLKNKKGFSPKNTPDSVEADRHELIFIDGLHAHPQVIQDFDGLIPYAASDTVFVWHDFWMPGIPECVEYARGEGYRCLWVPTSCEMVLGTKDDQVFDKLVALFPSGEENRPAHSKTRFYWLVTKWFMGLPVGLQARLVGDLFSGKGPRQTPKSA